MNAEDEFAKVGASAGLAALQAVFAAMGADSGRKLDYEDARAALFEPTDELKQRVLELQGTRADTEEKLRQFIADHMEVFEA